MSIQPQKSEDTSYHPGVNLGQKFSEFYEQITALFPENFYELMPIQQLETVGFRLKGVEEGMIGDKYAPNQLRKYIRDCLLEWGTVRDGMPILEGRSDNGSTFIFDDGLRTHDIRGYVTLDEDGLYIGFDKKDLAKMLDHKDLQTLLGKIEAQTEKIQNRLP